METGEFMQHNVDYQTIDSKSSEKSYAPKAYYQILISNMLNDKELSKRMIIDIEHYLKTLGRISAPYLQRKYKITMACSHYIYNVCKPLFTTTALNLSKRGKYAPRKR